VESLKHADWIHMAHDSVWLWSVTMHRAINLQSPVYMTWSSPQTQLNTQQIHTSTVSSPQTQLNTQQIHTSTVQKQWSQFGSPSQSILLVWHYLQWDQQQGMLLPSAEGHIQHLHKHQGLGHLARSVSTVTAAIVNVSSVSRLFSFLVDYSGYEGWNFNSGNYLFTTDTK